MKLTNADVQTGLRYWRGELASTPIAGEFRPSRKDDVFDVCRDMKPAEARRFEQIAAHSIRRGEGVFSVLAAGASSRMNMRQAPSDVRKLLKNRTILSKAAVPIGVQDGGPWTYLSDFGFNLSRLLHLVHKESVKAGLASSTDQNEWLLFSNPAYLKEHQDILRRHLSFGLSGQVRFMLQPLGPKFWAAPEDVRRLEGKVGAAALRKMLAHARKIESVVSRRPGAVLVPNEREPLGHGEYFHQMIAGGDILRWLDAGKKWIFVRNIDNCAAKLDRTWLRILGRFLDSGLDFQVEVSPRSVGQSGGSLIVMKDTRSHQIAEDPNILATNRARGTLVMNPSDSYWFNDAVAVFSPRYVLSLYKDEGQSDREFARELSMASRAVREKIAERGRRRFPSILDVKPARFAAAATVKRETNLWQSTGLVPDEVRVRAIGVRGARHLEADSYFKKPFVKKMEDLANLRFLSTKQWFLDESVVRAARKKMEKDMKRRVSRAEALLNLETYAGNRVLFADLMRYVREAKLVTPGILRDRER